MIKHDKKHDKKHVTCLNDHWIMNQKKSLDSLDPNITSKLQHLPQIGLQYALANFRPQRSTKGSAMFSFRVDFIFRPCVASKGSWQSQLLCVFSFPSEKNQGLFYIQ